MKLGGQPTSVYRVGLLPACSGVDQGFLTDEEAHINLSKGTLDVVFVIGTTQTHAALYQCYVAGDRRVEGQARTDEGSSTGPVRSGGLP